MFIKPLKWQHFRAKHWNLNDSYEATRTFYIKEIAVCYLAILIKL